eukprot:sb/3472720/
MRVGWKCSFLSFLYSSSDIVLSAEKNASGHVQLLEGPARSPLPVAVGYQGEIQFCTCNARRAFFYSCPDFKLFHPKRYSATFIYLGLFINVYPAARTFLRNSPVGRTGLLVDIKPIPPLGPIGSLEPQKSSVHSCFWPYGYSHARKGVETKSRALSGSASSN